MEKKLEFSYQKLLWRIVGAIRRTAMTIPAFCDSRNGCIRITIVPLSSDAEFWLGGGLSDFDESPEVNAPDVCEREFVYKIEPTGSHTTNYTCEDGHFESASHYGRSALKTAWRAWKQKLHTEIQNMELGEFSTNLWYSYHPDLFTERNGWSTQKGSVCTTITLDDKDFIRLYVCTSGAKSSGDEDEECSLYGILEAQKCFGAYRGGVRFNPYIDASCTPLSQKWHSDTK